MTDELITELDNDLQWHQEAVDHYKAKAEAFTKQNPYTAPEQNPYLLTQHAHQRAVDALKFVKALTKGREFKVGDAIRVQRSERDWDDFLLKEDGWSNEAFARPSGDGVAMMSR